MRPRPGAVLAEAVRAYLEHPTTARLERMAQALADHDRPRGA